MCIMYVRACGCVYGGRNARMYEFIVLCLNKIINNIVLKTF